MSKPVKRSYRSTRREEQARQTRARIREAATALFVERGYAGTSIAAVAEAAGVAAQTVFAVFGNKAGLLSEAIDVALAGDDLPITLAERAEWDEASTSSADAAAAEFARATTEVLDRAGRLIQVADAAAQQDASLVPMWIAGHKGRLADLHQVAESFAAAGYLGDGVGTDTAAELLWVLTSPDTFRSFTAILDWSSDRYQRWLHTTIVGTLFRAA